jgi:Transposase
MARGKRYQPEQVVNLLRQIEVAIANGKTTAQACKEAEIVEQTYFRWRSGVSALRPFLLFRATGSQPPRRGRRSPLPGSRPFRIRSIRHGPPTYAPFR